MIQTMKYKAMKRLLKMNINTKNILKKKMKNKNRNKKLKIQLKMLQN